MERPQVQTSDGELEPSHSIEDISDYSAQIICSVTFNVPVFRNLSLKNNFIPAAKVLGIKTRGMGKYELATKIAQSLVKKY